MPMTNLYYTVHDSYKDFPFKDEISKNDFILITQYFNSMLYDSIIREGEVYRLPFRTGMLGVFKKKTPSGMQDLAFFKQHGIKKTLLNNHSDNQMCSIRLVTTYPYSNLPSRLCNFFKLSSSRDNKRKLAYVIKNENTINLYRNLHDY